MNPTHIERIGLYAALFGTLLFLFDLGFPHFENDRTVFKYIYTFLIFIASSSLVYRYFQGNAPIKKRSLVFDVLAVLFSVFMLAVVIIEAVDPDRILILPSSVGLKFAIFLLLFRKLTKIQINYGKTNLNPAQLFILSFLIIILAGSGLLMLPSATHGGISFLDAFFTSTSAVCVTGLIVVDTATYFTPFGQFIIMALIQIGGLGILTFASYFSYFFREGSTYENQLVLSDITNSKKVGEVFSLLKNIILITFSIELAAAILIYVSLPDNLFPKASQEIFFSVFHAISAYCNAGFSTFTNGLYEEAVRYNYSMHMVIIMAFVLGGLGFPIVINIVNYLKYILSNALPFIRRIATYKPWVLNLNSRINLITTSLITVVGFFLYFITEYNHTLKDHHGIGKVVSALFGATTPRTAGFNTVDMASLSFPTVMIVILLMWIGASPSSTGGGIKTSTFAIATLNILSLAKGKSRIELFRREVADITVRRTFAIISLSLVVIGFGILLISAFDGDKDLKHIAFECFSAYSTVGLSLGLTASLSAGSKLILIAIMFVGRVSMLTMMIAIFKKTIHKNYRYPVEEISIN